MNRAFFSAFILALVIFSLLAGCSHSSDPVTPEIENIPITTDREHGGQYLWALLDVYLDPESGEAEIVPARTSAFEANVTRFLQPPASPINLLAIAFQPETNFLEGYVVCDLSIQHPFPGTKYPGFDVRGIVMGDSGIPCEWDPSLVYPDENGVMVLNADGYTRWWNQPEFTSTGTIFGYTEGELANHNYDSITTLNPFKYFADELDAETPVSDVTETGRGFFSSEDPGINTRRYVLQFPADPLPSFHFKYAITANWDLPIDGSTAPWTQDDFGPLTNQKEAYRITIEDNGSTAYYENETTYGGDLNLLLTISDWQLMDGTLIEDQVSEIIIESPTLFESAFDIFDPMAVMGGPDSKSFAISTVIEDVTPTSVDDQLVIVHVVSASPTNYAPLIPDPVAFDWPTDAELAAHTIWEAGISSLGPQENLPPVADASASDPTSGPGPLEVNLDPSNSYDPDGTIVLYEWDYENDGVYDISTVTPDVTPHTFTGEGQHFVNLRVTDDGGLSDELDEPLIITISGLPSWSQLQNSPNHSGHITDEPDLVPPLELDWSADMSSDNVYWVEGSPIVGDGFVMVLYPDFESDWAECFDLETGEQQWLVDVAHGNSNGYLGTPTGCYGDGRFYTPGDKIRALDPATGDELWDYDPNSTETMRHGLVFKDSRIYVHLTSQIHILDASNGDVIDIVTVASGWANFQPFSLVDDTSFIQMNGQVRSYDLVTGIQNWAFTVDSPLFGTDTSVRCSPTVPGDGKVYFGCYNGYFYAVDESDGSLAWKTPMNNGTQRNFDTAAYANGYIYYGECRGDETTISRFVCLDASDGSEEWSYKPAGAGATDWYDTSSPIVVNGVTYAGNSNGEMIGCDALTGDVVWSYTALDSASTDPAVAGGRLLFMSDDGTLYCFVSEG